MNVPASLAPAPATSRWPTHRAAIDMGSNSFRLEIGQLQGGRYRRVDYLKETVRLGAGLDAEGMLTEEASQRGLACLARFATRLKGYGAPQVRAVATQTLREARNRNHFLLRAQAVLGHDIEVISGREEARLIYAGVSRLQPSQRQRLVIDIGGRSTEMILGLGTQALRAESFQVGSVSLSLRYFAEGRFTEEAFRGAQIAAGAELEEALEPFAATHWEEALGSSGTVGAVSHVLSANGITDGAITPDALRWLMKECLRAGSVDKLALAGMKDDRRAVVGGGVSILYTLATHFGIEVLQPARGALRQGVIFDLDERLAADEQVEGHDARDGAVAELQQRFGVDVQQAARVAQVAGAFFEQAQPKADREAQRALQWAAALHEMGMMVSHHDHHRHSAYLMSHVDAAGFSQSQQRVLGDLLLAQRGGLRKSEAALADPTFAWQALCLRLAVIKCHARRPINSEMIELKVQRQAARLRYPAEWADRNPRTVHLLREEVDAWAKVNALVLALP